MKCRTIWITLLLCCTLYGQHSYAAGSTNTAKNKKRAALKNYVSTYYPYQLTYPQKKKRKSMSQFGYGLFFTRFPLFPITQFLNPKNFGVHSYSKPGKQEKNGVLYTCRGGFIDFAHMRCAADWTVYLSFKILSDTTLMELPAEGGHMQLRFLKANELPIEDVISIAQKIAYERLTWHEIASWYFHLPNHVFNEQQSTFTPEDTYSNFLGTVLGKNIALRILRDHEKLPYAQIASEEVEKLVKSLEPVDSKRETRSAYDLVDRNKQLSLPADKQNKDIWWDCAFLFRDYRYAFKRNMDIGPMIEPWRVPASDLTGCTTSNTPEVLKVPEKTKDGFALTNYYYYKIDPDSALFFSIRTGAKLHEPFGAFSTENMPAMVKLLAKEMEKELHADFNKRDSKDPVPSFKKVKWIWFRSKHLKHSISKKQNSTSTPLSAEYK